MPWQSFAFFVLGSVLGQYQLWRSHQHLAPGVMRREVWVRGPFAGRRFFTAQGWRERNRGAALQILAFLGACIIWFLVAPWW